MLTPLVAEFLRIAAIQDQSAILNPPMLRPELVQRLRLCPDMQRLAVGSGLVQLDRVAAVSGANDHQRGLAGVLVLEGDHHPEGGEPGVEASPDGGVGAICRHERLHPCGDLCRHGVTIGLCIELLQLEPGSIEPVRGGPCCCLCILHSLAEHGCGVGIELACGEQAGEGGLCRVRLLLLLAQLLLQREQLVLCCLALL